ncbi:histone-lysine N-methyltransferase SETMAR-like [Stegodyphus dumicola]|uniref:histone-lysine N-methyltransferase SETMAR-like n=1 Tax=Stegodyphus dumicola TaxID=202533 RepID=UPI0015AA449D|nr:histone-lysine N-methyltransferase SETMAR-like [Stegodyphus dumicola]
MSLEKEILRSVLLYEYKLGNKATEAVKRICSVCEETSMSERTAQKWFSRFVFPPGDESLEDKPHVGCPFSLDKVEVKEEIKQNPHQICQELAHRCEVSDETIRSQLHSLGMAWKQVRCSCPAREE